MTCAELTRLLIDKDQPASKRAEAARQLARECCSDDVWRALCTVADAEDDAPAVRCAAIEAMGDRNHYRAVNFLYGRRFRDNRVQAAAIAELVKIGSVEGEMEERLLADLGALRNGDANICSLASLPGKYGCDPRVLAYLRELLDSREEQVRLNALVALCGLGDSAPALKVAGDASAAVRAGLCTALGWSQEQRGADTLQQLLSDPDPGVANEAIIALRRLGRFERATVGGQLRQARLQSPWSRLLGEISLLRLADPEVAVEVPDPMVEAGWLGEQGATEQQIEAVEHRLGTRLPPSYREFLAEADGFRKLGSFIYTLFGTAAIDWFRNLNPDWIEAYETRDDCSPEVHLLNPLDPLHFRTAYLSSCLQISEVGDSAVVLLNPEVVTPEGEWETWLFADWLPGALRFPSFREYMEHELNEARESSRGNR